MFAVQSDLALRNEFIFTLERFWCGAFSYLYISLHSDVSCRMYPPVDWRQLNCANFNSTSRQFLATIVLRLHYILPEYQAFGDDVYCNEEHPSANSFITPPYGSQMNDYVLLAASGNRRSNSVCKTGDRTRIRKETFCSLCFILCVRYTSRPTVHKRFAERERSRFL